ncbi:ATP-binding protein [Spirillospora sp. CA-142024]|uniref:ATP-binding protein n=1 Tax=Spirillospora sp. CA-142024 TaxID=3240036 RepID=UPI003D8C8F59
MLMAECEDRQRRRSERRIKAAGFPRQKALRNFDFEATPNVPPAVVNALATCEWVRGGEPLCLIDDSGTGKSHLLISLGTEATMAGFRVKYVPAARLVNELVEAADELVLNKTIARYGRADLLFQVLTDREETSSVAIASNESFGGWTKTFTDPRLCAAIVHRLTFNATIIDTGTQSYRLSRTQAQQAAGTP